MHLRACMVQRDCLRSVRGVLVQRVCECVACVFVLEGMCVCVDGAESEWHSRIPSAISMAVIVCVDAVEV
jgi:hypothetical protein